MNATLVTSTRLYLHAWQAFIAGVLMSGIADGSTNLITNGSFETPIVSAGRFTTFAGGSTGITGWTVVRSEASVVNRKFTSFLLQFPANDGSQWLDLTGFLSSNGDAIRQTVHTVAGKRYDLSFAVGNIFNPEGIYGTTSTVAVVVNGVPSGTFTNSCTTCTHSLTWENFTASFVANSATTLIEFLNNDPVTDNSNGLDSVVLTEAF